MSTDTPQMPPAPHYVPPKEGVGKYVLFASIGCLFLLASAGALVYFIFQMTQPQADVVTMQLEALAKDDMQTAYSYCSAAFRQNTNLSEFGRFVDSFPILKAGAKFSSNSREMSGGITKLKGSLQEENGSTVQAEYHLVQEQNDWRIQYIYLHRPGTTSSERSPFTIEGVQLNRSIAGETVRHTIKFQVANFTYAKQSSGNRMHLVQDLKTFAPDGSLIESLTRSNFQELDETVSEELPTANFSTELTIPSTFPVGRYQVSLIVHDRISNQSVEKTVQFDHP